MIKVGLTGGIGSGKTTVAKIFESLGIPVYFADQEAKKLMSQQFVVDEIIAEFGSRILENGNIDRKALAAIVFKNPDELLKLNAIVHPLVRNHFEVWANSKSNKNYIIQEAAVLFESGFEKLFDKIITVSANTDLRIRRVTTRDNTSIEAIEARMQRQWTDTQRENKSDYIVFNNDMDLLLPQVINIHNQLLALL